MAFGALILVYPGAGIATLVLLFGLYAFIGAILDFDAAFRDAHDRAWLIVAGIVGLAAAAVALLYPALTAFALAIVMGFWGIFTGMMMIMLAGTLRKQIASEIWMMLAGVLTVILGVVLLSVYFVPGLAFATMIAIVATYAILVGIAFIGFALRVKKVHDSLTVPK